MKKFLVLFAIIGFSSIAIAGSNNVIETRQNAMKSVGGAMKVLSQMAKGEMAFDPGRANAELMKIETASKALPGLFPDGSQTGVGHGDHETEASPKIWSDRAGFDAAVNAFINDASGNNQPTDQAQMINRLGAIGKNCKSCHQEYRIKKN